jgi:hypothetical protein
MPSKVQGWTRIIPINLFHCTVHRFLLKSSYTYVRHICRMSSRQTPNSRPLKFATAKFGIVRFFMTVFHWRHIEMNLMRYVGQPNLVRRIPVTEKWSQAYPVSSTKRKTRNTHTRCQLSARDWGIYENDPGLPPCIQTISFPRRFLGLDMAMSQSSFITAAISVQPWV